MFHDPFRGGRWMARLLAAWSGRAMALPDGARRRPATGPDEPTAGLGAVDLSRLAMAASFLDQGVHG